MAFEHIKNAALPRTLGEVVTDVVDLLQKEIRLARAEITDKLAVKVQGGVWMGVAGVLGLVAGLLIAEAAVHGIASAGIALYWSYLIVGAVVALIAGLVFAKGRADLAVEITPDRTLRNIKTDLTTAKEQLR